MNAGKVSNCKAKRCHDGDEGEPREGTWSSSESNVCYDDNQDRGYDCEGRKKHSAQCCCGDGLVR